MPARTKWREPQTNSIDLVRSLGRHRDPLLEAERLFADARKQEKRDQASCVEGYLQVALLTWPAAVMSANEEHPEQNSGAMLYASAVTRFVAAAQRFGYLDLHGGVNLNSASGAFQVPIAFHGFLQPPEEFGRFLPVGDYESNEILNRHAWSGLGATHIVEQTNSTRPFTRAKQYFAATALLRPSPPDSDVPAVLELYNPLRMQSTAIDTAEVPIAGDITAPGAYLLSLKSNANLTGFLQPGAHDSGSGLFTLEPYQRGKIPIVFVHGLLSEPTTWMNAANEIKAKPALRERYQIWCFEYPTGEPFLRRASVLRRQLYEARAAFDPDGTDPAFDKMILVGHSMGGLVSKMQITTSEDFLWNSVANQPFDQVEMDEKTRASLAESFFFEPVPFVEKVVYIGTPHAGSPWAKRPVGQLGAALVKVRPELESRHAELMARNPGVFTKEASKRFPTSIDLLRTDSPLLQATLRLEKSPRVRCYTIAGDYRRMLGAGSSDGVVPVYSALSTDSIQSSVVRARHTKLHQTDECLWELMYLISSSYDPIEELPLGEIEGTGQGRERTAPPEEFIFPKVISSAPLF